MFVLIYSICSTRAAVRIYILDR